MHGNALEWCQDEYAPTNSAGDDAEQLSPLANDKDRVFRGGSLFYPPKNVRSANRSKDSPQKEYLTNGFRVARTIRVP
jgi:formylglycine-generating enzyme required for sulfatase activity